MGERLFAVNVVQDGVKVTITADDKPKISLSSAGARWLASRLVAKADALDQAATR